MVATAEGLALTQAHDVAQAKLLAQALQATTAVFKGTLDPAALDASFPQYAKLVHGLITKYRGNAAGLAQAYYKALRQLEGVVAAPPEFPPVAALNAEQAETSLLVTGPATIKRQVGQGTPLDDAVSSALQRTLGAVGRHVQNGHRDAIRGAVASDPHAGGWTRRSGGRPCSFCAMLIARGPIYKEQTASFRTHDHCHCTAVPFFGSDGWTAQSAEYRELWDQSAAGLPPAEARKEFGKSYQARYGKPTAPAVVRAEAHAEHAVRIAAAEAKKAAEEARRADEAAAAKAAEEARLAEEAAKKAAAKQAALEKKWKGKPAPKAPTPPPPPKAAKDKALDEWLGKVNARYDALGTGKKLSQSFNYSHVQSAMAGDRGALDYLKANHYLDAALHEEALAALRLGSAIAPADAAAYKSALRSFRNQSTRHTRYLGEWREVNGITGGSLAGMDGARDFTSNSEALDFAARMFHRFDGGPERTALHTYTGSSYSPWNRALRGNASPDTVPDGWEKLTRDADAGMARSPFPEDVYVRRGTNFDEFEFPGGTRTRRIPPPDPRELVGTVQTQHGYMSTSIGTSSAFGGDVRMVVRVPAGHKGAFVDYFSAHRGEREVLLQRSTQLFIHDVYRSPHGSGWIVEAEVVPPHVDPAHLAGHPTSPMTKRID